MTLIPSRPSKGFALPMTILVIAGLMVLMIGLIAMLSLERKTARSYSNATRAEMALQSGLSDALATLTVVASRDDTLVFRLDDPQNPTKTDNSITREQFFTYGSVFDETNNSWRSIPFFSGSKETTPTTAPSPNTPSRPELIDSLTALLNSDEIQDIARIAETDSSIARAKWIELPAEDTDHTIRYAWWVEDLAGKIDGRTSGSQPRDKGHSTAELGLFTLFAPTANTDTNGPEDSLIEKRETLLTATNIRSVLSEADALKVEPYLTYSPKPLEPVVPPLPRIPQGIGKSHSRQPTKDINKAVKEMDIDGIAELIRRNLPDFDNRKGGFPADQDYIKTLAASIIDYADVDSDATLGDQYRGIDSYPFVNELFDRYEWTGTSGGKVSIRVSTFVELWNPCQLSISGSLEFENQNRHKIKIPPSGDKLFTPITYPAINVTLPANGFKVLFVGEKTYQFPIGAFSPSQPTFHTTTDSNYSLKWNGREVDTARGGLQRTSGTLNPGSKNRKWKGHSSPALNTSSGQVGDPRASYYINTWVYANNYDKNTNWGGRCHKRSISNSAYNQVKISTWPDRGSDSTAGTNAGSDAKIPIALKFPSNQPKMAPAFISNTGSYQNLGEMGHIFDPSQWTDVEVPSPTLNSKAGGGYTLAIGRPEYGAFDIEGQRATQLIDLFHVIPDSTLTPTPEGAKININTAPREVLRTLVAGVQLSADPARPPLYPAKDQIVGDLFADAVINTRNHAPLRGLSDLALVRKDPKTARNHANPNADTEPFFGSRVSYLKGRPNDMWDDAGREELFQKVVNLVSFQGKSFRVVVAGEVRNLKGKTIGRASKEFHVVFEPERDNTGNLVPNGNLVIRKLYEKTL